MLRRSLTACFCTLLRSVVATSDAPLAFTTAFGSDMVLQQQPAKAAIYGTVAPGQAVIVTVTEKGGASYPVEATVGNTTWKAILHPTKSGGEWTITATSGNNSAMLERVTFGDVWYCGGQSNMALPMIHTFSHTATLDAIKAGKYANIRIHGISGNMNHFLPWTNMSTVAKNDGTLMGYSSTCWYYGQSLTEELELGDAQQAPPIGLVHTAFGGSSIEQWLDNETLATCKNVSRSSSDMKWHIERVLPYVDMTLKGWVWHQGENDMHNVFGNSALGYGYGCNLPHLVKSWRKLWSASAGTTDPAAPFGIATIANSGTEGGRSVGAMHWAQTANYGVLPNPALPNTFLAQSFDLNDPFGNITCYHAGCCPPPAMIHNTSIPKCHSCFGPGQYCELIKKANFYMGPIHPRDKLPVGQRLAKAGAVIAYGKKGPYTGPTISGCRSEAGQITINFNAKLLGNDQVVLQDYKKINKTSMEVLVNKSLFCVQTGGRGDQCRDDGTGQPLPYKGSFDGAAWVEVDIVHASATAVTVDLARSNGVAFAIRYGWSGDCCSKAVTKDGDACPAASCPLVSKLSGHPANPFFARIENGKCKCLAPQVCDESHDEAQLVV